MSSYFCSILAHYKPQQTASWMNAKDLDDLVKGIQVNQSEMLGSFSSFKALDSGETQSPASSRTGGSVLRRSGDWFHHLTGGGGFPTSSSTSTIPNRKFQTRLMKSPAVNPHLSAFSCISSSGTASVVAAQNLWLQGAVATRLHASSVKALIKDVNESSAHSARVLLPLPSLKE